jgi:hypothetical protein
MTGIGSLKLVAELPKQSRNVIEIRRNKICLKLEEQLQLAMCQKTGVEYTALRKKRIRDPESGDISTKEETRKVKPWWRMDGDKSFVTIRYGAKPLPLSNDLHTIETNGIDGVIAVLEIVRESVKQGSLDAQIEALAGKRKEEVKSGRPTLSLRKN